ncbi:MAG: COG1361 S-layer family protein [Infirmifilum sp.]
MRKNIIREGKVSRPAVFLLIILSTIAVQGVYSAPIPQASQSSTKTGATYIFTIESISVVDLSGTTKTVTVAVTYYGKYTLLGSSISLQPQCNASVLSGQPVLLGSWRPGTTKIATFTVDGTNASTHCPVGILVSWQDSWDDAYGMNTQMGGSTLINTELVACWLTDPRVSVSPQMVYMNTINSAVIEIANQGISDMRDVTVSINGQGVTLLNITVPLSYNVGLLAGGSRIRIPLQLVPQSSFPALLVTLSYVDCTGNARSSTFNIPLYATQGQSIIVIPDPATVTAGATNKITLRVVNLGSITAKNLQVILNLQGSPLAITPSVLEIGDLNPGEIKTFPVRVEVPSTASTSTPVSYQAIYNTPGSGLTYTQGSFTLFLLQRSSVTITSIEVVPQTVEVGSNVVFALSLINDGTYPVYAVNVSAYPGEGLVSSRTLYTYLGQLNPQVLTSVPFSFKALKEGDYEVRFLVTYVDAYGNKGSAERVSFVKVVKPSASTTSSPRTSANPTSLLLGGLFLLLVALGVYLYKRRSKKGAGS